MENKELENARELLADKSISQKYGLMQDIAGAVYPIFAVLSVLTGFSAFFEFASPIMHAALAVAVSVLFIALVEIFEGLFVGEAFRHHFAVKAKKNKGIRAGFARVFAAGLFFSASLVASVFGSYYGSKKLNTGTTVITGFYALQTDSIGRAFDVQITALDSTKAAYFTQNSWKGKLKNNAATEQFNAYEAESKTLRGAKQAALNQARANEAKDLITGKSKTEFNAAAAAVWVALLSLGKLASLWFKHWYAFRLVDEGGGLQKKRINPLGTDRTEVFIEGEPQNGLPASQKTAIGFEQTAAKTGDRQCPNCQKKLPATANAKRIFCDNRDRCKAEYNKRQ